MAIGAVGVRSPLYLGHVKGGNRAISLPYPSLSMAKIRFELTTIQQLCHNQATLTSPLDHSTSTALYIMNTVLAILLRAV